MLSTDIEGQRVYSSAEKFYVLYTTYISMRYGEARKDKHHVRENVQTPL